MSWAYNWAKLKMSGTGITLEGKLDFWQLQVTLEEEEP